MPGPRVAAGDTPQVPLGAAWVLGQVLAGVAVVVVGVCAPCPRRARGPRRATGLLVGAFGIVAIMTARRRLGTAFSVFPRPLPGAPVADDGAYRIVRHPMYTGVLAQATAVSIAGSPWALVPTGALAIILDRKAAYEERRLTVAHPAFADYADRTRWRFLPGVR
jgi:protein-S-isoprenylcysteine O-methyltransferase Ste14